MTTLPAALRNRYNQRTGAAAEEACMVELRRCYRRASFWRPGTNASARFGRDIHDLWDIEGTTRCQVLYVQVKATAHVPPLDPLWQARYLAWVRPTTAACYLAWLTPEGAWRVWDVMPDGRRVELPGGWMN